MKRLPTHYTDNDAIPSRFGKRQKKLYRSVRPQIKGEHNRKAAGLLRQRAL
jgi:hypothetical protein